MNLWTRNRETRQTQRKGRRSAFTLVGQRGGRVERRSLAQLPPKLCGNMTPDSGMRRRMGAQFRLKHAWFLGCVCCDICNGRILSLHRVIWQSVSNDHHQWFHCSALVILTLSHGSLTEKETEGWIQQHKETQEGGKTHWLGRFE